MSVRATLRIPEDLYEKIENSGYETVSQCIITAIRKFFEEEGEEPTPVTIYSEDQSKTIQQLESHVKDLKEHAQFLEKEIEEKNQQIMSLLSIQKDLTEKTARQIELLSDQTKQLTDSSGKQKRKGFFSFWRKD